MCTLHLPVDLLVINLRPLTERLTGRYGRRVWHNISVTIESHPMEYKGRLLYQCADWIGRTMAFEAWKWAWSWTDAL